MNSYEEQQRFLNESLKQNSFTKGKLFTRKRFKLDKALSLDDEYTNNIFSQAFRGFWVVESSDKDFEVKLYPNVKNSTGDPIPLRFNMAFDFGEYVDGCKLSFEAQAGKYIDVLFFHKGFAQLGSTEFNDIALELETSRIPEIKEVSTINVSLNEISDNSKKVTIINIGSENVFIGSENVLNDVEYDELADFLPIGESIIYEGSKQLMAKTFSGLTRIKVIKER